MKVWQWLAIMLVVGFIINSLTTFTWAHFMGTSEGYWDNMLAVLLAVCFFNLPFTWYLRRKK